MAAGKPGDLQSPTAGGGRALVPAKPQGSGRAVPEPVGLWLDFIPPSDNLRFIGKRRVLAPEAREFYGLLADA